jgi:F420 biosynthesis protein FbiB-like protein
MVADATDASQTDVILQLIRKRRSIRHFRDEPVPRDVLLEIVRAVQWAPSPHNSQPWRFTVLSGREDKARLAAAMAKRLEIDLAQDELRAEEIARQTSRSRQRIAGAPVVVLCSLHSEGLVQYGDRKRTSLEWQMAVQSVGAALQTLFLVAHTYGIGSCWMAAPMYCAEAVREALGLPPDFEPQALVLMGYEAHPGKVRERRPLAAIVDFR